MLKNALVLIALTSYSALAQISSGTIIVLNLAKDEIVVAADSRSLEDSGGAPDDSYCKIAALRHQFIFVGVGSVRYTKVQPASVVESWDSADVARSAVQNAKEGMTIDDTYMDGVISYWATILKSNWNSFCAFNRAKCVKNTALTGLGIQLIQLTAGIFIGAKGLFVRAATIDYNNDVTKLLNPVDYSTGKLSQCWPCGQGEQICAAGNHIDVAVQFCSERKPEAKLSARTALTRADTHAILAATIVEKTIDTYGSTAGDVGGRVDVVTITKDGKITWNARKRNCPENLD